MALDRSDLKNEAVKIDGSYIEDIISGYTTLNSSGRESLPLELESYTVGTADGETVKYTKYPARTITVEFLLVGTDAIDIRDKLNHLNNLLSVDEADFVFNDEADKYFTGIPSTNTDYERGLGWVTGTWQIYCPFPFKRSTAIYTAENPTISGNKATFAINYTGTYPARPILRAEFKGALSGGNYSDDGDCGYVAFMDDNENIIQLGNPDAIDLDGYTSATQLINHVFTNNTGWSTSGGATWGSKTITGSMTANSSINDQYWNKGTGQTMKASVPTYGTSSGWHGPILYNTTAGAVDFDLAIVHRMCASEVGQTGTFECGCYNLNNGTYTMVAGIVIEKTSNGTSGVVKYIVNGSVAGTQAIDLSYYNTNFGFCKRTAVKTANYAYKTVKKGKKKVKQKYVKSYTTTYSYTQSNLNTTINKSGSQITFKVGNLAQKTFTNTDVENTVTQIVSFHFGQNGSNAALNTNAIASVRFTENPTALFADKPNVFTAGDIVEADCNDASVTIRHLNTEEGHPAPQYGALGNDWENFRIQVGTNYIEAVWSDWVQTGYEPTLKILYNQVYL